MRHLIFLFFLYLISSCNSQINRNSDKIVSTSQDNFVKINSKDVKRSYEFDMQGAIIDTFPSWLKLIKKYSLKNVDTLRVDISNSKLALDYARLKLDSVYGIDKMESEKPFNVSLIDNKFWYVTGTLPKEYTLGGVAEILFSKYDGKVLYLIHGK